MSQAPADVGRRTFVRNAAALTLLAPGLGAALVSCRRGDRDVPGRLVVEEG